MKLVFCGTPEFAVPTLTAVLAARHDVALVLTQPDRPAGRGLTLQISPVKRLALERGLPVAQPETIRSNDELRAQLMAIAPDAVVVVAYGRIIPQWMLDLPPLGNINLHGSLLPKYRGAAPVQWAIAHGDTVTGVTTMRLDAGLDTGDMLLARAVPIGQEEGAPEVLDTLAAVGAELMVETLRKLGSGTLQPTPQDHEQATLAPLLTRDDGRIDTECDAQTLYNRWRAFYPWPGAYSMFRGKKLLLHAVRPMVPETAEGSLVASAPGALVARGPELLLVCGKGTALRLDELQVEGRKRMPAAEFVRGYQLKPGERLE